MEVFIVDVVGKQGWSDVVHERLSRVTPGWTEGLRLHGGGAGPTPEYTAHLTPSRAKLARVGVPADPTLPVASRVRRGRHLLTTVTGPETIVAWASGGTASLRWVGGRSNSQRNERWHVSSARYPQGTLKRLAMLICAACFGEMPPNAKVCPGCGHRPTDADVVKTRYKARELLDLGLSEPLVKFVMEEPRTGIFTYWCEDKYGGWLCSIPTDVTAVYPLWSCNGDLTVLWVRNGNREFVRTYHDDPESRFLAFTEQGLLARLFHRVMESQDWNTPSEVADSEQVLMAAAKRLGFTYMQEFLDLYMQSDKDPDGYSQRIEKLILSIDKKDQ